MTDLIVYDWDHRKNVFVLSPPLPPVQSTLRYSYKDGRVYLRLFQVSAMIPKLSFASIADMQKFLIEALQLNMAEAQGEVTKAMVEAMTERVSKIDWSASDEKSPDRHAVCE